MKKRILILLLVFSLVALSAAIFDYIQAKNVAAQTCIPITVPTVTGEFFAECNDSSNCTRTTSTGVPNNGRNFCFLESFTVEDVDSGGEWTHCGVWPDTDSIWKVRARTGGSCNDCNVKCWARCVTN